MPQLAHLKGCRELKISWDWETGSPPLSPSCAWACRDVWRGIGICWAVAACEQEPGDDCTARNTPPHLHPVLAKLHPSDQSFPQQKVSES